MEPELDISNKLARILIAGASNSGKSYLVSKLIQRWHKRFERIVVTGSDLENVLGMNVIQDGFCNPLNVSNGCESSLFIFDIVSNCAIFFSSSLFPIIEHYFTTQNEVL